MRIQSDRFNTRALLRYSFGNPAHLRSYKTRVQQTSNQNNFETSKGPNTFLNFLSKFVIKTTCRCLNHNLAHQQHSNHLLEEQDQLFSVLDQIFGLVWDISIMAA